MPQKTWQRESNISTWSLRGLNIFKLGPLNWVWRAVAQIQNHLLSTCSSLDNGRENAQAKFWQASRTTLLDSTLWVSGRMTLPGEINGLGWWKDKCILSSVGIKSGGNKVLQKVEKSQVALMIGTKEENVIKSETIYQLVVKGLQLNRREKFFSPLCRKRQP